MVTRKDVLLNGRYAGQILRYHTWPVLRSQSTGEHTWQCLRIYYELFGPLPPKTSTYLIWHDAGELVLGDLPFPVKANNGGLKRQCDRIEQNAVKAMGGSLPKLATNEKIRVKVVDLIEMLQYGLVEVFTGNRLAQPIVDG